MTIVIKKGCETIRILIFLLSLFFGQIALVNMEIIHSIMEIKSMTHMMEMEPVSQLFVQQMELFHEPQFFALLRQ